nr:hypothetical protein [Bacteroidota bacterium]
MESIQGILQALTGAVEPADVVDYDGIMIMNADAILFGHAYARDDRV